MSALRDYYRHHRKECFASIAALLLPLFTGVGEGFTSVLSFSMQDPESEDSLSDEQVSWLAALFTLTMPPGALIAGIVMEIYGRKTTLQLATILLVDGWSIFFLSDTLPMLCLGRIITGFAAGMEVATVVYITEMNTPSCRDTMTALFLPIGFIGNLLAFVVAVTFPWEQVALVFVVMAVVGLVALSNVPESPVWLMSHGKTTAALRSLKWLQNTNHRESTEVESADMLAQLGDTTSLSTVEKTSYFHKVIATRAWKPFLILLTFYILQELTGCHLMTYYSANVYRQLHVPGEVLNASMGYHGAALLSVFLFVRLINRVDRKQLCCCSAIGVCLSYLMVTAHTFFQNGVEGKSLEWLPVAGTWMATAFGNLGIYTLASQMSAELFPTQVRGFMTGLLLTIVHMWTFTCVKLYPKMIKFLTVRGLLVMFTVASAAAAIFGKFVLPETRGKTIAEIEESW